MDRTWCYSRDQIKSTWWSLQTTYTIITLSMRHVPLQCVPNKPSTELLEEVSEPVSHTSICSQWLRCVGLCIVQHQRLGQVLHLQNEAIDEHTSSWLGAPTLGLQQSCTPPTAQGSARVPSRVKPPYSHSQEHGHQTRRCSQCHGALPRPESMKSGRR